MIKILISSCLLGENCKWNGKSNHSELLDSIKDKVDYQVPFYNINGDKDYLGDLIEEITNEDMFDQSPSCFT